jgi:hypothetical protein
MAHRALRKAATGAAPVRVHLPTTHGDTHMHTPWCAACAACAASVGPALFSLCATTKHLERLAIGRIADQAVRVPLGHVFNGAKLEPALLVRFKLPLDDA